MNTTKSSWNPSGSNKPVGCCTWKKAKDGTAVDISNDKVTLEVRIVLRIYSSDSMFIKACRRLIVSSSNESEDFYFDGCFSKFEAQVKKNKEVIIWSTVGATLLMVRLNEN